MSEIRLLSVDNLKDGMHLAKNVYRNDGNVLLAKGVCLHRGYIEKLKDFGIASVYIVDDSVGRVEIDELVTEQTRNEATRIVRETMQNIKNARTPEGEKVIRIVDSITEELIHNPNIIVNLVEIRAMNDYTFAHCLGVGILAMVTGIGLGYDYKRLKELGIGALLHDVGKALIPDEILYKPGQLSQAEYEAIKSHTKLGYEIIRDCKQFSMSSAYVAWQHHEKYDGGGYPCGLKGEAIHEYARITALADVYDALTTSRSYREQIMPHEAIEYLRDAEGIAFDPNIAEVFLEKIAPFPVGSLVLLNNGEKAVVVRINPEFPGRPVVAAVIDSSGSRLETPVERDLKKDLTLFITKVLDD
ncbi:MAG: HD-GYP domain-containing protein [Firmicutes bacterium]|nr:HD-GYP domain-containing protein [Bacillota bacterium]